MESILLPSAITCCAVYIVLWQLDIQKILGYHVLFDISFTVILSMLFAGTYSGMLVAMAAGLMLSVLLLLTKWFIGYKKIIGWKKCRPQWKYFEE